MENKGEVEARIKTNFRKWINLSPDLEDVFLIWRHDTCEDFSKKGPLPQICLVDDEEDGWNRDYLPLERFKMWKKWMSSLQEGYPGRKFPKLVLVCCSAHISID
jgi:hypothetical protein